MGLLCRINCRFVANLKNKHHLLAGLSRSRGLLHWCHGFRSFHEVGTVACDEEGYEGQGVLTCAEVFEASCGGWWHFFRREGCKDAEGPGGASSQPRVCVEDMWVLFKL